MLSYLFFLVVFLLSSLIQNVLAQTAALATFNYGGIIGTIRFVQNAQSVVITVNLQNSAYHDVWDIHSLPVDLSINPQTRCSDTWIGDLYDPLNVIGTDPNYMTNCNSNARNACAAGDLYRKFGRVPIQPSTSITDDTGLLRLTGRYGIIGRSVVIEGINSSFNDICATIHSVDEVENNAPVVFVESYLVSPIGGLIYWRQVQGGETKIWGNLYWVTGMSATTNHHISILQGQPSLLYHEGYCNGVGDLFNPTNIDRNAASYAYCSPENATQCAIGDLSGKHGTLDIADAPGPNSFFFTDTTVNLMGDNSVIGHTIAVHQTDENSPILACTPLEVAKELLVRDINQEFEAHQTSLFTETYAQTSLDTSRLTLLNSVLAPNQLCHVALTATNVPVYNPFNVQTPEGRTITPDLRPIGDISGKGFTSPGIIEEFPLHGISTIALRSLAYRYDTDNGGSQEVCIALRPFFYAPNMIMARASFSGSISGAIYFLQQEFSPTIWSHTFVHVDLWYTDSQRETTTGHNWHVHVNPPVAGQECTGTIGGHFNPFSADISEDQYLVECTPDNQLRCESGDLSGKHGQLIFSPGSPSRESFFFIDLNLNLYGPENYSIIDRSIGLHLPSAEDGALFECAKIERIYPASGIANWTIITNSNFERTSFLTSLTSNLEDVRPDDILLVRQLESAGQHTGPEDPITVTFNARILGSSEESANNAKERLQGEIDALNNPSTAAVTTSSGDTLLALSLWTTIALQCLAACLN